MLGVVGFMRRRSKRWRLGGCLRVPSVVTACSVRVSRILRWVIAVWLIRVLDEEPAEGGETRFSDVDAGEWWAPYLETLADLGVTAGCATGPLRFCPHESVTRAQMASFLVRAFSLGSGRVCGVCGHGW